PRGPGRPTPSPRTGRRGRRGGLPAPRPRRPRPHPPRHGDRGRRGRPSGRGRAPMPARRAPPGAPSSRARRRPRPAGARPPPGRRARRAPPPAGARARASRRGGARAQPRVYGLPSGTPTMPMRIAYSASAVRPRSPSFWKMLFRCVFTVTSLIERRSATSALRSPMATWRTISISRGVSGSSGGSVRRAVRCLWSAGGIHTLPSTTAAMASISVSIAKRLKTTARAPERRAARASSARSLAVTTITVTRSARALMSTKALRSICRSSSRMSQGVAPHVAHAIEEDLQHVLDQRPAAAELGVHGEARIELEGGRRRLVIGQLADVGAEPVVLARDARLELPEGRERLPGPPAPHQLLAAAEGQIGAGQRLHAPVVE